MQRSVFKNWVSARVRHILDIFIFFQGESLPGSLHFSMQSSQSIRMSYPYDFSTLESTINKQNCAPGIHPATLLMFIVSRLLAGHVLSALTICKQVWGSPLNTAERTTPLIQIQCVRISVTHNFSPGPFSVRTTLQRGHGVGHAKASPVWRCRCQRATSGGWIRC